MMNCKLSPLQEPLIGQLGLKGDRPGVVDILKGTFDYTIVDEITAAYLKELKKPANSLNFCSPLSSCLVSLR